MILEYLQIQHFTNGYFSTNRQKSDDIFSFSSAVEEFANCDKLLENNFCFTFYDEQYQLIDTNTCNLSLGFW